MSLTPGTKLGPYEIVAPLGAGGMGEVHRARDTRLGRDVAVKVLPQHLSSNPEVRARFEREAKTVSSLNHPHICTLFDVGREGETDYLVMELVEGETLAGRLTKGAMPVAEVLRLGAQIADALDRAHRAGVVHRDLKPGNVMLIKSGAKLMDFGLARATGLTGPASSGISMARLAQSPTIAQPLTAEGSIIGTFQYMSPEQLEGKEADTRSDLWALGCVLYEMATGRRAFEGKSQASLISSIMSSEPPAISQVSPLAPLGLDRLVRNCLAKDPDERVQTAHDVKLQLQGIVEGAAAAGLPIAVATPRKNHERLAWSLMVIALLGAAAIAVVPRWLSHAPAQPVTRFSISGPENGTLYADAVQSALSPDGRTLVFMATDSAGTSRMCARSFESLALRWLAGTENATLPFWSPDSRFVAFFADGKLKKLPIVGGSPEVVCEAGDGRGASWGRGGVIVFAPQASGPLFRVPASGGEPTQATSLDSSLHEIGHRWPQFLPDGKHFLFVGMPARQGKYDVFVGLLDSKERQHLLSASVAPTYAEPGYIIFTRNASLLAQRFDPRRFALSGEPFPLGDAPPPSGWGAGRTVTASEDGIMAHLNSGLPNTELQWFDRAGNAAGTIRVPAGRYEGATVSPDGKRLCVARRSSAAAVDLWLIDLDRPVPTRFTFGPSRNNGSTWSPDGSRIAFASDRSGPDDIYVKPTSGAVSENALLTGGALFKEPSCWSPDGRFIVFEQPDARTGWDLWLLPSEGEHTPTVYLRTPFNERGGLVSPDGHWITYYSDESGTAEIYVQSFPTPGSKHQVSTGGGSAVVAWVHGGQELVFLAGDGFTLMSVEMKTSPVLQIGEPRKLFKLRPDVVFGNSPAGIGVTPDGQRFVITAPAGEATSASITIEQHWTAAVKKQ